ncbi:MAG TPA: DUF1858 domain-containing protein [Bacteroidales bacterium]|nr:DUF1858 domain-containing protein [Bacteroidales bacterium]
MDKLIITPKTKIYDLLEAFPELEETLIALAPEFRKLKNPLLRKTIARITNIGQAAVVGGLNVEEMVNRLREKAGQGAISIINEGGQKYTTARPSWFREDAVISSIDIREMLNRGEQPVHEVLAAAKRLEKDQILMIIAPFVPAPLLDKTLSLGYQHWVEDAGDGSFTVYLTN